MGDLVKVNEIFRFEGFVLRTLKINNKVYFNGHDVAACLGYKKTEDAVARHVDEKHKIHSTPVKRGGAPHVYISRPGMSLFALRSKMPNAEKFTEWVTEEVLESIYDTGKYDLQTVENYRCFAESVDRNTPNSEEIKKISDGLSEKMKDPVKQERGRRGGQACQQKYRRMRKELRQTKIDLTLFHLKDKLVEKCKDEIEKKGNE